MPDLRVLPTFYFNMKILFPLFLGVALSFGEQVSTETVKLEYKYESGKSYRYYQEMDMTMEMASPLGEGKMKMNTDMGMGYVFTALDHKKGVKVEMVCEELKMKSGMGSMAVIDFDSNKEAVDGDSFAPMFQPVLDMKPYAIYDAKGKPIEVGGLDDLGAAEQAGMDPSTFEQMFEAAYDMMPKEPVAVGESWTNSHEMPMGKMGDPIMLVIDYKLEDMEELDGHKVAKVSYKLSVDKAEKGESDSPLAADIKKYEGVYWHDLKENVTRKALLEMDMVVGVPEGVEVKESGMGEIPVSMKTEQLLKEIK